MSTQGSIGGGRSNGGGKPDFLLWGSGCAIVILYACGWIVEADSFPAPWFALLSTSVFELINRIWWGITIGILMVSLLTKVPREFVIAVLGRKRGFGGIVRATLGGVLLDLCSHGILMVGAKLYERGASAGQVIAFLVASPWNSFSLTLVLIALIGVKWTASFIVLSLIVAVAAGLLFDFFVARGTLPANPNKTDLPENFEIFAAARTGIASTRFDLLFFKSMITEGIMESRMVLRWIFFGVVLAALVRTFVDAQNMQHFFGPTIDGLLLTVLAATILEVCSEGSTPIAADLLARAGAPGNSFAFLMTGVATDYTEIMILKETTGSWKFSLFLPLVTLPQVLVISMLLNFAG